MNRRVSISIVSKYLFMEMFQPLLFCVMGLTVALTSTIIYELTDLIINKRIPVWTVTQIMLYRLPAILVMAFPISALFATVFALGRLVKDNEITAMRISGFGLYRIVIPFIILGLIVSASSYWINEEVAPWANHRALNLVRQMYLLDVTPVIKENIFFRGPEERYFYVRSVNHKESRLQGIMIYETQFTGQQTAFPRVITAEKGVFHDNTWELEKGVIHEFDERGYMTSETGFQKMAIPVGDGLESFFGNQKTTSEMSRNELMEEIRLFAKSGIQVNAWEVDYHIKLAGQFAPLIFVLIGVPLSLRNRKGWGSGVVLTIVVVFAYYVVQSMCKSFGAGSLLTPIAAAWIPNLFFGFLGLLLLWREEFYIARK